MALTTTKCPQCGLLHPPLKEGEICPMSKSVLDKSNMVNLLTSKIKILLLTLFKDSSNTELKTFIDEIEKPIIDLINKKAGRNG